MNTKKMLLSVIAFCTAIMVSAESNDTCTQMPRTQEMFQKDLKRFVEESQKDMLAQDIIPVDSTHLLTKEQKNTLKYAKNIAKAKKNEIKLPIEVNSLLSDTINKDCYLSEMKLEQAYFIQSSDYNAELVVPMQYVNENGIINSDLVLILDEEGNYYRIVETCLEIANDSIKKSLLFESNLLGLLFEATILENDKLIACYEIKENAVDIVEFPESKATEFLAKITKHSPRVILKSVERSEEFLNRRVWRHPNTMPSGYVDPGYIDRNWHK